MIFEDHCKECAFILGEPFEYVHHWLDEFAGLKEFGMRHRKKRHHLKGIEDVRSKWGGRASEAARLHIVSDLMMEGWKETDHFPQNEEDYVKMGLF